MLKSASNTFIIGISRIARKIMLFLNLIQRIARNSTRTWRHLLRRQQTRCQVSQGILDQFGFGACRPVSNAYESIKAFSETNFTGDLKKIDVPTLVMHGDDDQIVPVKDSA